MTHIEKYGYPIFRGSIEQQTGQYSMQKMAIFGSNFGANQHRTLHAKVPP
jgi:hypothetical protein